MYEVIGFIVSVMVFLYLAAFVDAYVKQMKLRKLSDFEMYIEMRKLSDFDMEGLNYWRRVRHNLLLTWHEREFERRWRPRDNFRLDLENRTQQIARLGDYLQQKAREEEQKRREQHPEDERL